MNDPGMIVLPTHRLFRGLPEMTAAELTGKLNDHFDMQDAGESAREAQPIWEAIEVEDDQRELAFFTTKDQRWTRARLNPQGISRMAEIAGDHSADWQGLGVSILHWLAIETLLDGKDLPKPKYVHLVDELVEALETGDTDGKPFPLAAMIMPATLGHIRKISEHGERMPAKSTYFYPKLLSGLVVNPLV